MFRKGKLEREMTPISEASEEEDQPKKGGKSNNDWFSGSMIEQS